MKLRYALTLAVVLGATCCSWSMANASVKTDALRLAQAQLDMDAYGALFQGIAKRQLELCSVPGAMPAENATELREKYGDFIRIYSSKLADVQVAVAAFYEQNIPVKHITVIANFFESPTGHRIIRNGVSSLAGPMTAQLQLCGDRRTAMGFDKATGVMFQKISAADMVKLRTFANAPSGKVFTAASTKAQPVMQTAFLKAAQEAMKEVGFGNGGT